jgi:hypothetical protein
VDWGDVWDTVSDTVTGVTEVIVSTVLDPVTQLVSKITAQVNLIIDGVKAVFDATIDFVEQGFEMAAGIFAKIEVWWNELKDWLAFLFSWPDIVRTAEVLSQIFTVGLGFMGGTVGHVRTAVDSKIDALSNFIDTRMDAFIAGLAGKQTIGDFVSSSKPAVPAYDERVGNNPLLDAFIANCQGATPAASKSARATDAIDPVLQKLLDALTELANKFQNQAGNKALGEAIAYFAAIQQRPDQIMTLSLQGLLKLGEAVALFALGGLKGLLDLFFEAIQSLISALSDFLTQSWTIPVVGDLYAYATGKDPSFRLIDLFSLMVAAPVTALYKAARGAAPFPDAASVSQVTNTFTVGWLDQIAWGSAPKAVRAASAADAFPWQKVRDICNMGFAINFYCRAPVEFLINLSPVPIRPLNSVNLVQRILASALSIPWVMKDHCSPPWNSDADGWENMTWIFQCLWGPLRGGLLFVVKAPGELADATPAVWGALHLVFVSVLADKESDEKRANDRKTAENVLACLAPQMLKMLRLPPFPQLADEFSYPALAIISVATEPVIGDLHWDRTLDP